MRKKNLFVCHTYYHVLLSLILKHNDDRKSDADIILSDTIPDVSNLSERLISEKTFAELRVIHEGDGYAEIGILKRIMNFLFNRILFFESKELKEIDLKKYNDIFIFHDNTFVGMKIIRECQNVHLCEDGKRHYHYINDVIYKRFKFKKIVKDLFVALNLKFDEHGRSTRVKSYYITNKSNIVKWMESKPINIIDTNKLDKNIINLIKRIMISENISNLEDNNVKKAIILTQPLYQDGFVDTPEKQLSLYKYIISDVQGKYSVFIKPHPRDECDYSKVTDSITVLNKNFPVEVFNYTSIKFDLGCTIGSSSIYDNEFILDIKEYNELISH